MRILVVEDETALREQLVERLRGAGYAVDAAADGEEALYFASEYPVDLAIVDLGLPKLSGIEVVRRLRSGGRSYPVLILTARGRWQDKVEGLEAGADDYLVKPFHYEELLARMRALLRRAAGVAEAVVRVGPFSLDPATQEVRREGESLELTAFEFRTLEYLMMRAGHVVSKAELAEHIYDEDADRDSNVIEVFVGRLRRKLDPEGQYRPIETLRGRGYRFSPAARSLSE
jgi:two-component system response regulator PhoP